MLKKNILIVFILTLVSKGLGFYRDIALVNQVGAGSQTDIFFAVSGIIETFICLFGIQALYGTASKLFSEVQHDLSFRSKYFTFFHFILLMITSLLALVIAPTSRFWIQTIYPGFDEATSVTASIFLSFFIINLPVLSLLRSLNFISTLHHNFYLQNLLPVFSNILFIVVIFVINKSQLSFALLVAISINNFLFLIIQYVFLFKKGYRIRSFTGIDTQNQLKKIVHLVGPLVFTTMSNSLFLMYTQYLGSSCDQGTITLLSIGYNLVFFSIGLIFMSVLSVAFPTMITLYHKKDFNGFYTIVSKIIITALIIFIPISLFFILNSEIIVKAIYYRKNFSIENVILLSKFIFAFSFGIVPMILNLIPNHILQSYGANRKVLISALITFLLSMIVTYFLFKLIGGVGISWGITVYHVLFALSLWFFIRKEFSYLPMKSTFFRAFQIILTSFVILKLFTYIPFEQIIVLLNKPYLDNYHHLMVFLFRSSSILPVYAILFFLNRSIIIRKNNL